MNKPIEAFKETVSHLICDEVVVSKVIDASEQMIEDLAVELAQISNEAMAATLLTIYKTGDYPGRLQSDRVHQLAVILAQLGRVINGTEGANHQGTNPAQG